VIFAHRGARAHAPENTLEAFRSALDQGAEYLETDLVPSKTGALVLRHERRLSQTTDVEDHPEFGARRVTKLVHDRAVADWWVEDFTVAELATLRATKRNSRPAGDYGIPTLHDLIHFVRIEAAARDRRVGLYLEVKQPEALSRLGYDVEKLLAKTLSDEGLGRADGDVYVQSFETASVQEMSGALRLPAVQLISAASRWDDDVTPAGLRRLAEQGVEGLNVVDERLESDADLVNRAHAAGLVVHGWGFEPGENYGRWISAGLDGFVTDDVPAAVAARGGRQQETEALE
jgi:glycerophosphoryl diester phosphodiesterase